MPVPSFWSNEFLVNSTTASDQYDPHVTAFDDGRFAVVYGDASGANGVAGTFGEAVDARIRYFDADGTPLGDDMSLGTETALHSLPSIAWLEGGRAAVVWSDFTLDSSNSEIRVRLFGDDGAAWGPDVQVNASTAVYEDDARVVGLVGGGFVVVWTADDGQGGGGDIYAQMFNSFGDPMGPQLTIESDLGDQDQPEVAPLADGGFAIVWRDASGLSSGDGDLGAIRLRRFDSTGYSYGPDEFVNTTTVGEQSRPSVARLADGGFVVTWTDYSADYDGAPDEDTLWGAVRGQVYDAAGNMVGDEFRVNTEIMLDQMNPSVTGLPDGVFLVVWVDGSRLFDAEGFDIRAQAFEADGTPRGDEVIVNESVIGHQTVPSVAAMPDGRVIVTWQSEGGDASEDGIIGRILDPRIAGMALTGTDRDDHYQGSDYGDAIRGGDGNDRLHGANGNDKLYGGTGTDSLEGGAGDDYYVVDSLLDQVIEQQDGGLDRIAAAVDWMLSDNVEQLVLMGTADLRGTGNALDNRVTGNAGANSLLGLAGRDRLDGMDGDDVLYGGSQGDSLYGGEGDDVLSGGSSGDRLFGGEGDDKIYGGLGADTMTGGAGDDYYVVDDALDLVVETADGGRDRVASSVSLALSEHVEELVLFGNGALSGTGNALANRLTGNGAGNTLRGLDGDDRIEGGGGSDVIEGGGGRDVLRGGAGDDLFVFASTADSPSRAASDAIWDFAAGDRIDLSALDAIEATAGVDDAFVLDAGGTFAAGEIRQVQDGSHWRIEAETNGDGIADLVILLGGHGTPLGADDFVL